MGEEQGNRKRYWWNLNIDPDKETDTGRRMMRTIAIWFAVIVALIVIIVVVR
jgi:nitrogen fixation protein FixH